MGRLIKFVQCANSTPLRSNKSIVKQRARRECRSVQRGKAPISKTRSRSKLTSGMVRLADFKDGISPDDPLVK